MPWKLVSTYTGHALIKLTAAWMSKPWICATSIITDISGYVDTGRRQSFYNTSAEVSVDKVHAQLEDIHPAHVRQYSLHSLIVQATSSIGAYVYASL